jgi:uncharacterized membrane protein YoaK (UPF0700 family)
MTTRFAQEVASLVLGRGSTDAARLYGTVFLAFVAGASLAVFCELRLALWSLAIPIAALVLLAAAAPRRPG